MRIKCPCCEKTFDVPIRAILAEADRIRAKKSSAVPVASEPNGNVLSPHDLEAKRQREEAIRRRENLRKKHESS